MLQNKILYFVHKKEREWSGWNNQWKMVSLIPEPLHNDQWEKQEALSLQTTEERVDGFH